MCFQKRRTEKADLEPKQMEGLICKGDLEGGAAPGAAQESGDLEWHAASGHFRWGHQGAERPEGMGKGWEDCPKDDGEGTQEDKGCKTRLPEGSS